MGREVKPESGVFPFNTLTENKRLHSNIIRSFFSLQHVIIRHTQVLFRQCQCCCYPGTVRNLAKREPLRDGLPSPCQQRGAVHRQHRGPPCQPHGCLLLGFALSLGARSEFSTSINHRVPNGRLSFGMRPIAEGAAAEAVAEAALIA